MGRFGALRRATIRAMTCLARLAIKVGEGVITVDQALSIGRMLLVAASKRPLIPSGSRAGAPKPLGAAKTFMTHLDDEKFVANAVQRAYPILPSAEMRAPGWVSV